MNPTTPIGPGDNDYGRATNPWERPVLQPTFDHRYENDDLISLANRMAGMGSYLSTYQLMQSAKLLLECSIKAEIRFHIRSSSYISLVLNKLANDVQVMLKSVPVYINPELVTTVITDINKALDATISERLAARETEMTWEKSKYWVKTGPQEPLMFGTRPGSTVAGDMYGYAVEVPKTGEAK